MSAWRALLSIFYAGMILKTDHVISGCTTVGVSPGAALGGKPMVSQSNDGGATSDTRLFLVPSKDHGANATRPIFAWTGGSYPRYVGTSRGSKNYPRRKGQNTSEPIGYIPQVLHTYAYYDAAFGLMNEHGLGMAESTCTARVTGALPRPRGKALWYTDELGRVALERTTNARDAIKLMGELAYTGGFYGEDNVEGTGESFIVVDKVETWVFHVLSSDESGSSAVWAAQRVPDGHVTVVPNIFVIREMNLTDADNFMASPNIHTVAIKNGWWDPTSGHAFDFTKAYSNGEYNHKYYSGRRWWGAMGILVPTAKFPDDYGNLRDDKPYPFSVPVSQKIDLGDVMKVMRSFYENTKYDLTQGLAAGAFGNPNRFDGEVERPGQPGVRGAWERSISIYRSDYSHIIEIDPDIPADVGATLWFGPVMAATTCYIPLLAGQTELLSAYSRGHKGGIVDRSSAMWAFRYVQQIANIRWNRMIVDIKNMQNILHKKGLKMQAKAASLPNRTSGDAITSLSTAHAELVLKSWWALGDYLISTYADGQVYVDATEYGPGKASPAGYPVWWLEAVGYPDGPPPPESELVASLAIPGNFHG